MIGINKRMIYGFFIDNSKPLPYYGDSLKEKI